MLNTFFRFCNCEKTCGCVWNEYSNVNTIINSQYFWENAWDSIEHDICFRTFNNNRKKRLTDSIKSMYNVKSSIWTKCNETYAFIVGIDPMKKFHVRTCLNHVNSDQSVEMSVEESKKLFESIRDIYAKNISYPQNEKILKNDSNGISIALQSWNNFKIKVGEQILCIDDENLQKLETLIPYLEVLIQNCEAKRNLCEKSFLQLLSYCHTHLNTNIIEKHDSQTMQLSTIVTELIKLPCSCAPQIFILHTLMHFIDLLQKWLPIYQKTCYLSETARLETFNQHWPHKFINIKDLAKYGFYYIGPEDQVKCIFCNLILYNWIPSDTPLNEHFKYSANCRLLNPHIPCPNIPDNSSTDMKKLLIEKRSEFRNSQDYIDMN